jgi:hypothetical protein
LYRSFEIVTALLCRVSFSGQIPGLKQRLFGFARIANAAHIYATIQYSVRRRPSEMATLSMPLGIVCCRTLSIL